MARTVVTLHEERGPLPVPAARAGIGAPLDQRGRALRDLRISVTDRCNFRCSYCMPKEVFDRDYSFLPQSSLLTFEEIVRVARLFVAHGVKKIRLTGGEPLLRRDLERLVAMLAEIPGVDGERLDLTLTTNGSILERKAAALKAAGLGRVTVSLDAIDDTIFRRMNDADFPVADVLRGIDAAERAGLGPIKVNMVVKREDLRPGDLVFFNTLKRTFSHVGIYIGDNRFVHSPRPGKNVRTEDMSFAYWAKRFTGARRVETTAAIAPAIAAPVPAFPADGG